MRIDFTQTRSLIALLLFLFCILPWACQECPDPVCISASDIELYSIRHVYPESELIGGKHLFYDNKSHQFIGSPEWCKDTGVPKMIPATVHYDSTVRIEALYRTRAKKETGMVYAWFQGRISAFVFTVNFELDSIGYRWGKQIIELAPGKSSNKVGIESQGISWGGVMDGPIETEHRIYRTFGPALAPMNYPNWITVLDSACHWASGETDPNIGAARIMAQMGHSYRHIYNLVQIYASRLRNHPKIHGLALSRYLNMSDSLAKRGMNCISSTYAYKAVFHAMGIPTETVQVAFPRRDSNKFCTNPHLQVGHEFAAFPCRDTVINYSFHSFLSIHGKIYEPTLEKVLSRHDSCSAMVANVTLQKYIDTFQRHGEKQENNCVPRSPESYRKAKEQVLLFGRYEIPTMKKFVEDMMFATEGRPVSLIGTQDTMNTGVGELVYTFNDGKIRFDIFKADSEDAAVAMVDSFRAGSPLILSDTTIFFSSVNKSDTLVHSKRVAIANLGWKTIMLFADSAYVFLADRDQSFVSPDTVCALSDTLKHWFSENDYWHTDPDQGSTTAHWQFEQDTIPLGCVIELGIRIDSTDRDSKKKICRAVYQTDKGMIILNENNKIKYVATQPGHVNLYGRLINCCGYYCYSTPLFKGKLYVSEDYMH